MSYEAGSKECRHLIEAKESLLSTLDALSNIHSTDLIQIQIKDKGCKITKPDKIGEEKIYLLEK